MTPRVSSESSETLRENFQEFSLFYSYENRKLVLFPTVARAAAALTELEVSGGLDESALRTNSDGVTSTSTG